MNQSGTAICKFGSSRVGQISHCRLPGSTGSSFFFEMRSKSDLTKEWTKSFAGRIARLKAALHVENRIDEAADWGAD